MKLKELTEIIMQQAKEKGWNTNPEKTNVGEMIALIHSELSEALEAYRKHRMTGQDGFSQELGDAVTRIIHLAGIYDVDLEKEILAKLEANKNRDWSNDKLIKERS